jgi:hypothetical protein
MIFPNVLLSILTAAAPVSASHLVVSNCEAGEHHQFESVKCQIELRNTGDKAIRVSKAVAQRPWDSIQAGTIEVPPKGAAYIEATVDLRNDEGLARHPFRFATDEPGQALRGSEVRAYVQTALDQNKPKLDFGVVKLGIDELPSASTNLSSREVSDFRITGIDSKPEWLDANVDADGHTVHAKLNPKVPWGLTHNGSAYLKVSTNVAQQPHAWIEIDANVLGDVMAGSNPFQLGMMRTVGKHEFLMRISSRSGKEFEIGKLTVVGLKATATAERCVPAADGCRLVRLEVDNNQPTGKLEGVLNIELPASARVLPVELVGILLTPDVKIVELNDVFKQGEEGGQSKVAAPVDQNLGKAIAKAVKGEEAPPPGKGPLLRWSVAHQALAYGYAIYRSDSEEGPFVRISKEIIHAAQEGADEAGSYQWRDNSAESGKTYWYQIGVLNRNGSKQDLSGAQKVVAK